MEEMQSPGMQRRRVRLQSPVVVIGRLGSRSVKEVKGAGVFQWTWGWLIIDGPTGPSAHNDSSADRSTRSSNPAKPRAASQARVQYTCPSNVAMSLSRTSATVKAPHPSNRLTQAIPNSATWRNCIGVVPSPRTRLLILAPREKYSRVNLCAVSTEYSEHEKISIKAQQLSSTR
jgi:hypothetical protein